VALPVTCSTADSCGRLMPTRAPASRAAFAGDVQPLPLVGVVVGKGWRRSR
jgi:hypothetical protein